MIATKQITENSECIPGSTPLPFIMTSPPDSSSETVPTLTEDTKTTAVVVTSSPMEGVIEEEITMLQIRQTPAEASFTAASLLDGASPTSFASASEPVPLTPVAAQSSVLPKECNVTWPQTPESVVQEQKQEQEQSEPMDEDVIMEESETRPPTLQETPAVANQDITETASDEFKKDKSQQDMDVSDSDSDQDDDDCNDNDNDDDEDDEDDEEAPSDKKGKARDGSSSSSHSIPREPTILSFDDAVYSAVPVSSELYIIPFCSKGFNWNADLFLKPHQRRNLGLDDLYRTLSTESRLSSSGSTSTSSSSDGSTEATSVDSRPSSSGASNNGHSHGSAIHVHEIWLSDLDTATILPA